MQKPNGYDEVQASGDFTPIELGGHYCVIKQVQEVKSESGKDMIVVVLDFCNPDKQKGYFSERFENDTRTPKKWPYQGVVRILVYDFMDQTKASKNFKTFCTSFERSNNVAIQWGGNDWAKQFAGKYIGAVYGEEENEYDGKITMRHVVRWFCSFDSVESASIPQPKLLKTRTSTTGSSGTSTDFMTVPETASDVIPF